MNQLNRLFRRKGWWLLTAIVLFFIGGSWGIYQQYYSGKMYYTQITTVGQKKVEQDDQGGKHISYQYRQKAYDDQGRLKKVDFNGVKSTPLKHQAYLQLRVNPLKGVVSWQKVDRNEVPRKALKKISADSAD